MFLVVALSLKLILKARTYIKFNEKIEMHMNIYIN